MAALRTRKAVVLAKVQDAAGQAATPNASTDAVLTEVTGNPFNFNFNTITPNTVTGSLDTDGPIIGGMTAEIVFDVFLKGSGTAGTAPEFGTLLKGCGWGETATATAVPSDAAEAVGADSAGATDVTLGSSASSTDDVYNGMPLELSGDLDEITFVADYVGTTKKVTTTDTLGGTPADETTTYQILKNVCYKPISSSIPWLTLYVYVDGLLYQFIDAQGNVAIELASGGPGRLRFRFTGLFVSKTDAAVPSATLDTTRPPIWKGGVFNYNRVVGAGSALTLDSGNQLIYPDNPNGSEGYDSPLIVARNMAGNLSLLQTLVATRDILADVRSQTPRIVHARYGSTAGNRVAITIPDALPTNEAPADQNGLFAASVPFFPRGADAGAYLTFF